MKIKLGLKISVGQLLLRYSPLCPWSVSSSSPQCVVPTQGFPWGPLFLSVLFSLGFVHPCISLRREISGHSLCITSTSCPLSRKYPLHMRLPLLTWKDRCLCYVQSQLLHLFSVSSNLLRDLAPSAISSFMTPASSCSLWYKIYSTFLNLRNLSLISVIGPITHSNYPLLLLFLKLLGRTDYIQQVHFCTTLLQIWLWAPPLHWNYSGQGGCWIRWTVSSFILVVFGNALLEILFFCYLMTLLCCFSATSLEIQFLAPSLDLLLFWNYSRVFQ